MFTSLTLMTSRITTFSGHQGIAAPNIPTPGGAAGADIGVLGASGGGGVAAAGQALGAAAGGSLMQPNATLLFAGNDTAAAAGVAAAAAGVANSTLAPMQAALLQAAAGIGAGAGAGGGGGSGRVDSCAPGSMCHNSQVGSARVRARG